MLERVHADDPLLFSLSELSANDQDGVFDKFVLRMLTSSDWDPHLFSTNKGVAAIRKTIHDETLLQYGAHITRRTPGYMEARLDCIRKIQKEWDTKQGSMKREVQISVINNVSVDNRARLAVHLAMSWYKHQEARFSSSQ